MPDDIKIGVSTPGAPEAQRSLKGVAEAERNLGKEGKQAGDATKKGAQESREAFDDLGRSVGINMRVLGNWKLALVAAVAAGVAGIRSTIAYLHELRKEMRGYYREFVDLSQQPGTRQLAQLRGQTEAETAKWLVEQKKKFGIPPEEARAFAFELESGIAPEKVGGPEAFEEIRRAGHETIRSYAVPGGTMGGLTIAGYEAGIARTPEEFRAFYAKAGAYAESSRVSLQQIAQIASELLPAAVAAGITPDQFLGMVAAMSYRLGDPGRVRTSLERMIRAAGMKSGTLEAAAEQTGRRLGELSTLQIMGLQSDLLSGAMKRGGPQAAMAMAEELNVPAEVAQVYASAFDPAVRQRMAELMGTAGAKTWAETVAPRFAEVITTPEAAYGAAEADLLLAKQAAGREQAVMAILEKAAEAYVTRMMGEGKNIPGVMESLPLGKERATRWILAQQIAEYLREIPTEEARQALYHVEHFAGEYKKFESLEPFMMRGAQIIQQQGTIFNGSYVDPAGRPRLPENYP